MSATMKAKLSSLPPASTQEQTLLDSSQLHLSSYNVYLPDRLLVVMFITNKGAPLSNVALQFNSQGFLLTFDGEPVPSVQKQGTSSVLTMAQLGQGQTATQIMSLQCDSSLSLSIPASASANGLSPSSFSVPLTMKDLLRPCQLNTQQYGASWGQYSAETKFQMASSVGDSASFMACVKAAGLFPVQTIGLENITAGALAGPNNPGLRCLLHGKVVPGQGLEVTIHTKLPAFSQQLGQYVQSTFR